jgi:outer membrane protein, multidrug efflux system
MKKLLFLAIAVLLSGCAIGPNYKRPTVNVPTDYRGAMPAQPATVASLGSEKWWDVYREPVLTQLIHTALQQNYDVRIAATRVLEAQDQLGIVRANQLPAASLGASLFSQQNAKVSNQFPAYQVNAGELNLSAIWNLDFWGKYRRQTEAARAQMLATEWGQRAVMSSLVANVATAYFQLRALDSELEIAKRTLGSRRAHCPRPGGNGTARP